MKYIHLSIAVILFSLVVLVSACGSKESESSSSLNISTESPVAEQQAKPKLAKGELVYRQYCQTCHQADGKGVENLNPPLNGTDWVIGDKERLIKVILNGLAEEIEVNGKIYNNVMASHNFLSDKQIADVLTYIRSSFGNNASAISIDEVAALRQ